MGGEEVGALAAHPRGETSFFGVAVDDVELFSCPEKRPGKRKNIKVERGDIEMSHPMDVIGDVRFFYGLSGRLGIKHMNVVPFLA